MGAYIIVSSTQHSRFIFQVIYSQLQRLTTFAVRDRCVHRGFIMGQLIFLIFLTALALIIILFMFMSLKKARILSLTLEKNTGLLSFDFFIFLMFFFNMWIILFLLYATKSLLWSQKQVLVIIFSLCSIGFVWWWRKRLGAKP